MPKSFIPGRYCPQFYINLGRRIHSSIIFHSSKNISKMFSLIFALFFLLISVCAANQQSPYWPYYSYPYGAQQNGGFYQQQPSQQFRQFGAQYPPYQQPYSPFYNRYGGYSSPYSSPNSYYGYGTNSQQYQQQRPFGQFGSNSYPFGSYSPYGTRQYPFYPSSSQGFQYDGTTSNANNNFYSSSSPFFTSPFESGPPFIPCGDDGLQLTKKMRQRRRRAIAAQFQRETNKIVEKRQNGQGEDETEFTGLSINLPLMSLAMPEMPPMAAPGEKCKVQKNLDEGDYLMAFKFVC